MILFDVEDEEFFLRDFEVCEEDFLPFIPALAAIDEYWRARCEDTTLGKMMCVTKSRSFMPSKSLHKFGQTPTKFKYSVINY